MTPGERVKGFIGRIGPLKLLPVRCNYCDGLPTEHTETCPETAMRRLAAENELLRAKCAAMGRALEGCIEELVCFHPKMNAEEPCATYGTWLRAKESLEDNPGQALLKYVEALEPVREAAHLALAQWHSLHENLRIQREGLKVSDVRLTDSCDNPVCVQLREALAACKDGQEELK